MKAKAAATRRTAQGATGPVIERLKRALERMRDGARSSRTIPTRSSCCRPSAWPTGPCSSRCATAGRTWPAPATRAASPQTCQPSTTGRSLATLPARLLPDDAAWPRRRPARGPRHRRPDLVPDRWWQDRGVSARRGLRDLPPPPGARRGRGGHRCHQSLHAVPADRRPVQAHGLDDCRLRVPAPAAPGDLGEEPISVGLWVGEATSPNRYGKARERFDELRDAGETDERSCSTAARGAAPRSCRASTTTTTRSTASPSTDRSFAFNCPSTKCEFHEQIPVHVVDDALYDTPPTFLLGTVDKFAQLAWVPESGVLFGRSAGQPPTDPDHPGRAAPADRPLGTTVGLYEAAINLLCEVDGRPPKVISSHGDDPARRRADHGPLRAAGRPVPADRYRRRRLLLRPRRRGDTGAAVRRHDGAGPHL